MSEFDSLFQGAHAYCGDIYALPVEDLDITAEWYASAFGMQEVDRYIDPDPTIVLERGEVKIGFSINGRDPSNDGAVIDVSDIEQARSEMRSAGVKIRNWRIEKHDSERYQVFFVVAPDGLCFLIRQKLEE